MNTGGIQEGIRSRPKALIAWFWKRSVEVLYGKSRKRIRASVGFLLALARIELLTAGMIKKPRQCFESNRMDRYLGSSSPTSSDGINELWEEDLWPVDLKEADLEDRKINNCMEGQFVIRSTGFHGSLWMILRMRDSSLDAGLRQHHQSTPVNVPVNVPDWSKVLGVDHLKEQNPFAIDVDIADEEEEEKEDRLPPHEYLAREDARCRVFSKASILQGVGLKGREMSRVRNAVWRQTGFLG